MNRDQYDALRALQGAIEDTINVKDLRDKTPRTLLYGYTLERATHHVYICPNKPPELGGAIVVHVYRDGSEYKPLNYSRGESLPTHRMIPDKRLYPERCDYEFCLMLKQRGLYLPFTAWDDDVLTIRSEVNGHPFWGRLANDNDFRDSV